MIKPYLSKEPKLEKLLALSKMPWQAGNSIFKDIHDQVILTENRYQESLDYRKLLKQQSKHLRQNERRWANICAKYAFINDDQKALACLIRRTTYRELNVEVFEQLIQQAIIANKIKNHLFFLDENVIFLTNAGSQSVSLEALTELSNKVLTRSSDIESAFRAWRFSMIKTKLSKREHTKRSFKQIVDTVDVDAVATSLKKELCHLKKRLTVLNGKLIVDKRW